MSFPARRMRRLRRLPALRRLVAESSLAVDDLVAPLFVRESISAPVPIDSLPGVSQHTVASLVLEGKRLASLGIGAVVLFGVPAHKDPVGSGASDHDGIVQVALGDLRDCLGDELVLIADLCLDEYTDHGHCGVLDDRGEVDNDADPRALRRGRRGPGRGRRRRGGAERDDGRPGGRHPGRARRRRARRGRDPRLLGQVRLRSLRAVPRRGRRDHRRGRRPAGPTSRTRATGARRSRKCGSTWPKGADMVMVKPALAYLDVIAAVRAAVEVPVAAYHVSGEYAMVEAAAERGWIDGPAVALEQLGAIKRAGADFILTYFAAEVAEVLGG